MTHVGTYDYYMYSNLKLERFDGILWHSGAAYGATTHTYTHTKAIGEENT
jgi:hypothetical protein